MYIVVLGIDPIIGTRDDQYNIWAGGVDLVLLLTAVRPVVIHTVQVRRPVYRTPGTSKRSWP